MNKQSKQERLAAELVALKAKFEAMKVQLAPIIAAEDAKREALKKERDKLENLSTKAYMVMNSVRATVRRKFPDNVRLQVELRAWAAEHGWPDADPDVLATAWIRKRVSLDPEVVRAKEAYDKVRTAFDVVNSSLNAMHEWSSKPRTTLRQLQNEIDTKEDELQKIPRRNERAKELRAERAKEERQNQQTADALKILDTFEPLK